MQYERLKRFHSQTVQVNDLLKTHHMRQEVLYSILESNCFFLQVDKSNYFINKFMLCSICTWWWNLRKCYLLQKAALRVKIMSGIRKWCGCTITWIYWKSLNFTIWNGGFYGALLIPEFLKKLPQTSKGQD